MNEKEKAFTNGVLLGFFAGATVVVVGLVLMGRILT